MKQIAPRPFDFQPVIIIGAARSGTNMLRDALARMGGVVTWPCDEINAIWRYRQVDCPTDELPTAAATDDVRQYIRRAFLRLARRSGGSWVVEKTCANSLRVDFVRAVLPECKFLFLVRDGRDVVASAAKRWRANFELGYTLRKAWFVPWPDMPRYALRLARNRLEQLRSRDRRLASWGPRFNGIDDWAATRSLEEVCAQQWSQCVLRAAEQLSGLPPSAICFVRYEQLVAGPRTELARIAKFLELPLSAAELETSAAQIHENSVGRWHAGGRGEFDSRAAALIDSSTARLEALLAAWTNDMVEAA